MTRTTKSDIMELIRHEGGPCVSIYMPATPAGPRVAQNRIRFKNLLADARRTIAMRFGLRDREEEELLAPAEELLHGHEFWRRPREGLALFAGRRFLRHYDTPIPMPERVVVGDHFYVKPLVKVASGDGHYHVLCLSLRDVRLYACTRYTCRRVPMPGTPTDLRDVVGHDVEERHLQWHTGTPGGGGQARPAIFHGQGGGEDDLEPEIRHFLSTVDSGVRQAITEHSPLVLVGLDHQSATYRQVSRHPTIAGTVDRSPTGLDDALLLELTWPRIEPIIQRVTAQAIERITQARDGGRATDRLPEVVSASLTGRVDTLVYHPDAERWGRVDPDGLRVETCRPDERGGQELVDLSVVQTLSNGGRVHATEDPLPDDAPMAALLRY
jgi:hypothetical protein